MSSSLSKKEAYKKYEFKKLCFLLGCKQKDINNILTSINTNYSTWTENKLDKNGNPKTYLDGTIKTRTFRNPSKILKEIQKRIKKNILDKIPLPECVHGGIKKRSNITNAKAHQGNKYIFETDLQEFYPNINMTSVYKMFMGLNFSSHISHWLTTLTTIDNELPQGSPTSQAIANLVFVPTDLKLLALCKKNLIVYTRYVDDLTFSSQKDFKSLTPEILSIVTNDSFKISRRKTNYGSYRSVTGIEVFLNKIDAPIKIIEKSKEETKSDNINKPYTNYLNNIRKTNRKKRGS